MESMALKYGIPRATAGALAELKVCADLMKRGFHVFRALSAACPCDVVIFANGEKPLRVEVKTAYRRGERVYGPSEKQMAKRNYQYDILALVIVDEIVYDPPFSDRTVSEG